MSDGSFARIPRQPSLTIRPVLDTDIDHILRVQQLAYEPYYWESATSFRTKVVAGPDACCGAWFDGAMVGYLIAVPLPANQIPDLNSESLVPCPADEAEVMFIHDISVDPDHRARGVADVLLVHLYESALRHQIEHFRLISVQGSQPFWEARGFTAEEGPAPPGYGPEAVLMSRR